MESNKGTIMRGLKGFWSRSFLKPLGHMKIYLIPPRKLLERFPQGVLEHIGPLYNLSAAHNAKTTGNYFDCNGVLDFYFEKAESSSKIAHFNPGSSQGNQFLEKLYSASDKIKNEFEYISFALDERRVDLIAAFEKEGIKTGSRSVVGGLSFIPKLRKGIISLNTDEI
jgi:hypothetical protein